MRAHTHAAVGLAMGLVWIKLGLASLLPFALGHGFLTLVVFSSLLPDIDHAKSAVGRKLPVVSHTISAVFGHRRLFHGLFGCAISCAVIYFICQVFAVGAWKLIVFAVAFGYVAHLVADSATIQGIRWFYPVKWFHTKGPIETGSINEWIFMGIMLFLIGVLAGDIGFSVLHFV